MLNFQGLTQAELSRKAGYSRQYMNDLVRGRTPLSHRALARVATALNVKRHTILPANLRGTEFERVLQRGAAAAQAN